MTTSHITARGWLAQARAGLPDNRVHAIVGTVAALMVAGLATLAFGLLAAVVAILVVGLIALAAAYRELLGRWDDTRDEVDKLTAAIYGTGNTGRHAKKGER